MGTIEFFEDSVEVDALIIADGLGMEAAVLQEQMRKGKVTGRCEHGIDEDEGRYRLTFFTERRRLRLVIDKTGKLLQRSVIDFGNRPLPARTRKPGS
jgi:hypothetical protein